MPSNRNNLIIGIGSHVVAIDPSTGNELWRTRLKMSDFVTVHIAGDVAYAGAGGELFCLDAVSGEILWRNKLKGLGNGLIAFSGAGDEVFAAQARRRAAAASAAT